MNLYIVQCSQVGGLCESLDGSLGWEGGKAAGEQLVGVGTSPAAAGQLDQAAAWQEVSRSIPAWCWWVRQSELRWVIGCGALDWFTSSFLPLLELFHSTVRWGLGQAAGQGWQIAASAALSSYRPSRGAFYRVSSNEMIFIPWLPSIC